MIERTDNRMIPKVIHYFYDKVDFYRKEKKHTQMRMCYSSWVRCCPDYQIKLWDPTNEEIQKEIQKSLFIQNKFYEKDWAFVSDYVRAYVLFKYGGIYLDTDVELLGNFEDYLSEKFFCSIEGDILKGENIPEPAVMGSVSRHPLLEKILSLYESDWILQESNPIANVVAKKALKELYDFRFISYEDVPRELLSTLYDEAVEKRICTNFELYKKQRVWRDSTGSVSIYPSQYFCPSWVSFKEKAFTDNTVAIHWNQSSWWKEPRKEEEPKKGFPKNKSAQKCTGCFETIIRRLLNKGKNEK